MAELLEIAAHGVTAILATWIGLLVITRARRARGAGVFALLCSLLAIWSTAILVQRLTADPTGRTASAVNLVEVAAAWLLPAATVHIALAIAFEGRWSRLSWIVLATAYAIGFLGIAQAVVAPHLPIGFEPPHWEPMGVDGGLVAWVSALARLAVWLAGVLYLIRALRTARHDRVRHRQLLVALVTVGLGVVGGMLRILPPEVGGDRWIGVSLVALATVFATYAVLAQHIFLAPDVTRRAVVQSVAGGIVIVGYVVMVGLVDGYVTRALAVDIPLVMALALVGTVALFEPVAGWARGRLADDQEDRDQQRLLAALGADPVLGQRPDLALAPVLERLTRTFDLTGAVIESRDGRTVAAAGSAGVGDAPTLRLPLVASDATHGAVTFVGSSARGSFRQSELRALRLAASYLAASLRLAERQEEQASALGVLASERQAVLAEGERLTSALARAGRGDKGLHVFALGPLRVERDGEPIRRWGGPKAGSRQAEAIFAVLFDRGERGATKDEILEIVWPETDLSRADVAFHRTMLGLRSTLEGRRTGRNAAVSYSNDRYRLDLRAVTWSDVAEVERLLEQARGADERTAIRALEQVRTLHRGDYMDDVPYFGDSAMVEERRDSLRRQLRAVLHELADRYEARGDRMTADAYRRAPNLPTP
jgi:hypothetical protein